LCVVDRLVDAAARRNMASDERPVGAHLEPRNGIPYVSSCAPTEEAKTAAIASAVQPASRNATDTSLGCAHSDSLSPPRPMHCPVISDAASVQRDRKSVV